MKMITTVLLAMCCLTTQAQTDEDEVKTVINSAYIAGIHNNGPIENIRKGFHPSFNMLRLADNELKPLSIEEWIKNIELYRAKNAGTTSPLVEGKFVNVAVAGTSASVVLELTRSGKKIFTDHLLLYKFVEGWRIVSKTYYRYP